MFSKLMDLLVDNLILNKKPSTSINYNNPLIYSDRQRKTHTQYAKHITKKHNTLIPLPKAIRSLTQKSTHTTLIITLLLATSFSFIFFRHQFFILAFIMIGAISRMTQKYVPLLIGIDFCLFFSILVSIAYSPTLGMLTGIIASTIGSFLRQIERAEYYLTPIYGFIPVWIIMSLSLIPQISILLTGMICVATYILARFIMISMTFNICIANQLTYITTTLIFNYWLFSTAAPFLMTIMA